MNLQAKSGRGDGASAAPSSKSDIDAVVVRFAGDSGDGVQLLGTQFAQDRVGG